MAAKTFDEWWFMVGGGSDKEQYRNVWNAAMQSAEEKFTSTNTNSPKLPLYSEIKETLQSDLREPDVRICLNWFWYGVKRCYKLIEKSQLLAGA